MQAEKNRLLYWSKGKRGRGEEKVLGFRLCTRVVSQGQAADEWCRSLFPLFLFVIPVGSQALYGVALHVQEALELLGFPFLRQGDDFLREHCRDSKGETAAAQVPTVTVPLSPGLQPHCQGPLH